MFRALARWRRLGSRLSSRLSSASSFVSDAQWIASPKSFFLWARLSSSSPVMDALRNSHISRLPFDEEGDWDLCLCVHSRLSPLSTPNSSRSPSPSPSPSSSPPTSPRTPSPLSSLHHEDGEISGEEAVLSSMALVGKTATKSPFLLSRKFFVKKVVLCRMSEYFAAMFSGPWREGQRVRSDVTDKGIVPIRISDVSPEIFHTLLHFMHTHHLILPSMNLSPLSRFWFLAHYGRYFHVFGFGISASFCHSSYSG